MAIAERSIPSVGFVAPSFDRGGLEKVVYDLYRACKRRGWSATIFSEGTDGGVLASALDTGDFVPLSHLPENLFAECIRRRIGVLHYNYSTFLLEKASLAGLRTIYTIHNYYTWLGDDEFASRAKLISEASAIVAVSNGVKDYFCGRSGISHDKVGVITNGVAVPDFSPPVANPAARTGPYAFANIASFNRVKHHALLIRAAEKLLARGHEFRVLLIGGEGNLEYEAEIDALLSASPARSVILKLGHRAHDDVLRHLRDDIDVVALPSMQEGCSLALLEALASGVPVITTDTGAAREAEKRFPELVTVIPCAIPTVELTSSTIERLSRAGDCANLGALVEAMERMMKSRRAGRAPMPRPFPFDAAAFEDQHLSLIKG